MADVTPIVKRAEEMFQKQQYDYAISLFRQALAQDPDHEKAHRGLAVCATKKVQASGGTSRFKTTVLMTKTLGQLKMSGKNPTKKIDMCLAHLVDDPNNVRIRLELANSLYDIRAFKGGAAEAQLCTELDPRNAEAFKILGLCKKEDKDITGAQEAFQKCLSINPSDRDAGKHLRDLAALESMKGSNIEKAKSFRDTLKSQDNAKDLEAASHLLSTDEDVDREIQKTVKELEENPSDFRLLRRLGDIYADKKKDFDTAAQWYQKAGEASPQDSTLRDKVDEMKIKTIDRAILAATKASDAAKLTELKVGKLKFEMQSYERRIKDRPTDLSVKFELGKRYILAGVNFADRAIAEFQLAVKDPKCKMESHIYLALAFQKKKMFDLARDQYEKAQTSGFVPPDKQMFIWYNQAHCYYEAGDKPKAVETLKRILTEDISYKDASTLVDKWTAESK